MKIINTISEMKKISSNLIKLGKTIALVPTMGALHNGHLSLFDKAKNKADILIASIFVNPTQFAPSEDFDKYPRNLEEDAKLALQHNVDFIFAPSEKEMYPDNYSTFINLKNITEVLEGEKRPTHFNGVAIVITKLFNIITPNYAFFGQKDYQQTLVIKQLVKDLNLSVEIFIEPTIRLENGLAMSSRNKYLTKNEQNKAAIIYKSMLVAKKAVENGIKNKTEIVNRIKNILIKEKNLRIDYICVALADNLKEVDNFQSNDKIVILIAVFIGKTRLIDNMLLTII